MRRRHTLKIKKMNTLKPLGKSNYVSQEEALRDLDNYKPAKNRIERKPKNNSKDPNTSLHTGSLTDPENWIFLEARRHGNHDFPDLYVCLNRLSYSPEVERIAGNLDFKVENTAQLDTEFPYIGNINHEQAMRLIRELGYVPLPLRTGVDFLKELRDGARGSKIVHDGNGNRINDTARLERAYKEIAEVRNPGRSEWFSDKFGDNTITHNIIKPDGIVQEVTEPVDGLMEDKKSGINLDYWLDNATPQGLPPANTPDGDLYYWYPRNGAVARFVVDSDGADLGCVEDSSGSDASLGGRAVREKI